jgi:hypothetical protein
MNDYYTPVAESNQMVAREAEFFYICTASRYRVHTPIFVLIIKGQYLHETG